MQLHKQKEYHDPKLDVIEDQEFCSVEHEAEGSLLEVHSNIVKHDFDSTPLDFEPAIFACVIEPLPLGMEHNTVFSLSVDAVSLFFDHNISWDFQYDQQ